MDGNERGDSLLRTFADNEIPLHRYRFVAPGYFSTLGTPLIAGRDITWGDIYNKVPVAIASEKVARKYWHDPARAFGQQIRPGGNDEWREIVGVVGDTREDGVDKEVPSSVFWPILAAAF